jgi:hypothetical protein
VNALLASFRAVLSAFIGIRRKSDAQGDQSLNPAHVVIVAIVCVAIVIATLIAIVRVVVNK